MKKLIIDLTDEQLKRIQEHFAKEAERNFLEETSSGYESRLYGTEDSIFIRLELEMNSVIDLGEVSLKFEK
jgi:hypothetical protein